MNPIIEKRYLLVRYVVLCAFAAALYAAAFGFMGPSASTPAKTQLWFVTIDWLLFTVVAGFEGLMLWNTLRYGSQGITAPLLRTIFLLAQGIVFTAILLGTEVAAAALATGIPLPGWFTATIPARILFATVLYACFVLWYSRAALAADEDDRAEAEARLLARHTDADAAPEATSPPPADPLERITVRGAGGKIEVIETRDILLLQAEGDYVAIVTASGRWLKEQTMKYFEEALPPGRFVRVHRSCIVAVAHITRIETSGREHSVIVRGGPRRGEVAIRTSESGYKLLRATLGL